ncbi:hypothetical protein RJ640_019369 [Escallonia rubra]|uniref:Retrotransposon gag domain-containing protein n=1 Tax=Escallonia rubra TaxID=112253 RepID=A0AA88URZ3_9ASTE|nr:hypothetical protein RJ640_019369 [Escallonia rubra]
MENTSKSATARNSSNNTSAGPVTQSRARDKMVVPNQVVVPVSKSRVQFREVVFSRYEKGGVSGSKVPHLELEENALHEMPPPSFQYASDADSSTGTKGDLLVKQFVRSLKGNAFDWYTNIEPKSIDYWEAMEREFLNQFYSTRLSVSMMELTNTRQWKDEHVVDYINRWCSLNLDCKERLLEISVVEICMQGMHWGLLYILQGNRPASFEKLATWAHDMEISITNHGGSNPALPDPCKETGEGKKVESLAVTTTHLKIPKKDKHKKEKAPEHLREKPRYQPSLKELEGKKRRTKEGKQQRRKGRRHTAKKSRKEVDEAFRQDIPKPITLGDFFPSGYLKDEVVKTVCMVSVHEDKPDSAEEAIIEHNANMLTSLQGLPLRDGEKKVDGDCRPFTEVESYFADAKFYMESETLQECFPTEISSAKRNEPQKEGQSPFIELAEMKEVKVARVPKKVDVQVLKEELTAPLTTIGTVRLPLKGFFEPLRDMAKHPDPPSMKTYEGFDAKA